MNGFYISYITISNTKLTLSSMRDTCGPSLNKGFTIFQYFLIAQFALNDYLTWVGLMYYSLAMLQSHHIKEISMCPVALGWDRSCIKVIYCSVLLICYISTVLPYHGWDNMRYVIGILGKTCKFKCKLLKIRQLGKFKKYPWKTEQLMIERDCLICNFLIEPTPSKS